MREIIVGIEFVSLWKKVDDMESVRVPNDNEDHLWRIDHLSLSFRSRISGREPYRVIIC
jgi:hypothetical protein